MYDPSVKEQEKDIELSVLDLSSDDDSAAEEVKQAARDHALQLLRPALEPVLRSRNLEWGDVLPALEKLDSIDELEAAVSEPEELLSSMVSSSGPVGKQMALAQLRPKPI